jgi:hypothetical protein
MQKSWLMEALNTLKTEGSIHKVAATILGAESCNGWTFWHYNLDGTVVPIDHLRQKLISKN